MKTQQFKTGCTGNWLRTAMPNFNKPITERYTPLAKEIMMSGHVISGEFWCDTCYQPVEEARYYPEYKRIDWYCKECGRINSVKRDLDNE